MKRIIYEIKNYSGGATLLGFVIVAPVIFLLLLGGLHFSLVFVGKSTIQSMVAKQLRKVTLDPDIYREMPTGGCEDSANATVEPCVSIEEHKQELINNLKTLFSVDPNHGMFYLPLTTSTSEGRGADNDVISNPQIVLPQQPGSRTYSTELINSPIVINLIYQIKSVVPYFSNMNLTITNSRYYEDPKKISDLVPTDCAGNPVGSNQFANEACNCSHLQNSLVSQQTGQCHQCANNQSNHAIPNATVDAHGCYTACVDIQYVDPVTNRCVCPNTTWLDSRYDPPKCVCVIGGTDPTSYLGTVMQNILNVGYSYNPSLEMCVCDNRSVTEETCTSLLSNIADRVTAITSGDYAGCLCQCKPCLDINGNLTNIEPSPLVYENGGSGCKCLEGECISGYAGPNCDTCDTSLPCPAGQTRTLANNCQCACSITSCPTDQQELQNCQCICKSTQEPPVNGQCLEEIGGGGT